MTSPKISSYYPTALLMVSFAYALWIWIAAKSPWHYYESLLTVGLLASICFFGIGLLAVNIITAIIGRTVWPLAVFALCALLPWLLPTITPEELYFSQHRAEYDKLVELVRLKQIQHAGNCQVDDYIVPAGFEQLSVANCILVRYDPEIGVMVTPRVRGRLIFYAESNRPDIMCSDSLGVIEKKIGEHWYICDSSGSSWP